MPITATNGGQYDWVSAARAYLAAIMLGNLFWEAAQLPLYTIWSDGSRSHLLLAMFHGSAGDLFIASAALMMSIALFGTARWPTEHFVRVAGSTIMMGLGYTIYSEWMNVVMGHTWAYSKLMPTLPPFGIGVSPLLEWIIIPVAGFSIVNRRTRAASG